jgi:hypothetical protein
MSDKGSVMGIEAAVAGKLHLGMASEGMRARPSGPPKEDSLATTIIEQPIVLPVPEPLAQLDPVLLRAAEIVRERGLCQGPWRAGGPLCAAGAVGEAGSDYGLDRADMETRVLRFARSLGGSSAADVHTWNDVPGRTADEVAEALERAAYGV